MEAAYRTHRSMQFAGGIGFAIAMQNMYEYFELDIAKTVTSALPVDIHHPLALPYFLLGLTESIFLIGLFLYGRKHQYQAVLWAGLYIPIIQVLRVLFQYLMGLSWVTYAVFGFLFGFYYLGGRYNAQELIRIEKEETDAEAESEPEPEPT